MHCRACAGTATRPRVAAESTLTVKDSSRRTKPQAGPDKGGGALVLSQPGAHLQEAQQVLEHEHADQLAVVGHHQARTLKVVAASP